METRDNWRTTFGGNVEELVEAHVDWLQPLGWDWFATLTLPGYPRKRSAERKFEEWITRLQAEAGADDFRWVRAMEHGAYSDNVHFHLVVGGLKSSAKTQPERWQHLWSEITGGEARIERFDPNRRGLRYVLKSLHPDRDAEIEFKLPKPGGSPAESGTINNNKGEEKSVSEKTYKGVLRHRKSTKSQHVFGNKTLPAQYLPRTLLGDEPPATVEMAIRWELSAAAKPARSAKKESRKNP